jgi:hypothetical protein
VSVESVRLRLLLIGPVRLALSGVLLVAARAAGGSADATLIAFAVGAFALAFLVPNDPRARFRSTPAKPEPLPAEAVVAPAWLHVVHAALPSTVGVSVLAAVALAFNAILAALLAGVLTGLGLAALYAAYRIDDGLYIEPRQHLVFRK